MGSAMLLHSVELAAIVGNLLSHRQDLIVRVETLKRHPTINKLISCQMCPTCILYLDLQKETLLVTWLEVILSLTRRALSAAHDWLVISITSSVTCMLVREGCQKIIKARIVFFRIKMITTNFLFWKWTIDARNKFYTWSHLKIFLFASVIWLKFFL